MSQFCTQCGTENLNEAKFCKSCGYSLIEKEPSSSHEQSTIKMEPLPKQDEVVNVSEIVPEAENSSETPLSWNGWLLLIPVIAWVLYRLGVLADGNIVLMFGLITIPNVVAEALGGAAAIVGIPLIVTGIIYLVKKTQDVQYTNFVKHTLIASIVLLAFGIAANINTIRDEQKGPIAQMTSEDVAVAPPVTAEAVVEVPDVEVSAAVVARADDTAMPVLSKTEQAEQDCNGGNADACYFLGRLYDDYYEIRDSVKKDNKQAVKFYKKACDSGNANACVSLGTMYGSGQGIKIDGNQNLKYYKKGCDGGRADACEILGTYYDGGRIIGYEVVAEDDKTQAARFYKKACDGGNTNGCAAIGSMYSLGEGVKKDFNKAFPLLKKGCGGDNADACAILGSFYAYGLVGEVDSIEAARFYKKGCDRGSSTGCSEYKKLQSQGY
ncbi:MAG: zinc-ribbon domain-containing protein [Sulfuricurvum sp.]|nr:zinc-ribbon domain-containing protein [Sulfuricurvum sp.]MDP3022722.1 zinc-ribbon domain-containing protein [Sulfuricurvum sp.]